MKKYFTFLSFIIIPLLSLVNISCPTEAFISDQMLVINDYSGTDDDYMAVVLFSTNKGTSSNPDPDGFVAYGITKQTGAVCDLAFLLKTWGSASNFSTNSKEYYMVCGKITTTYGKITTAEMSEVYGMLGADKLFGAKTKFSSEVVNVDGTAFHDYLP